MSVKEEGIKQLSLEVLTKASEIRDCIEYFATLKTRVQGEGEMPYYTPLGEIEQNLAFTMEELRSIMGYWLGIKEKLIGQLKTTNDSVSSIDYKDNYR